MDPDTVSGQNQEPTDPETTLKNRQITRPDEKPAALFDPQRISRRVCAETQYRIVL